MGESLLYLTATVTRNYSEGKTYCASIPGHRLVIFKTLQQKDIILALMQDHWLVDLVKSNAGAVWGDGTLEEQCRGCLGRWYPRRAMQGLSGEMVPSKSNAGAVWGDGTLYNNTQLYQTYPLRTLGISNSSNNVYVFYLGFFYDGSISTPRKFSLSGQPGRSEVVIYHLQGRRKEQSCLQKECQVICT
nr:uncharacterized protein LOC128703833 [Cherax quadricarinatus]